MHKMSPGVERAVTGARAWAGQLGSKEVRLNHFVLALLDEEEGRPAVLLERAGITVSKVREEMVSLNDAPEAPSENQLFNDATNWSLAHRRDPEFLTDALLIAVLRANPIFEQSLSPLSLNSTQLEQLLTERGEPQSAEPTELPQQTLAVFSPHDASSDLEAARAMDANLNRAREATRVLEDYCRFALDDRFLTGQTKQLRHELAALSSLFKPHLLIGARETEHDVGKTVSASGEYDRHTPAQVASANVKRLQESLRSLEEFGKLFAAELGRAFETLRYQAYTLERALFIGSRSRERLSSARLYILLTGSQCQAALDWTIEKNGSRWGGHRATARKESHRSRVADPSARCAPVDAQGRHLVHRKRSARHRPPR